MTQDKINIAELLRNCPKGMELDCTIYEDVCFDYVDELNIIHCYIQRETHKTSLTFNQHGTPNSDIKSKCVIFPKGKTTWEGFHRPFVDGDIIYNRLQKKICIYYLYEDEVPRIRYCRYNESNIQLQFEKLEYPIPIAVQDYRLATEEEKAKLFKAIKDNGYKWNAETKTLERLIKPKFKVGDRIKTIYKTYHYVIKGITDTHYTLEEVEDKFQYIEPIVEDKNWELVADKFDITTLKPFESKVLMRSSNAREWVGTIYSHYNNNKFYGCGMCCDQCIPYEGNEHLLGKTDDCDEYFKNW